MTVTYNNLFSQIYDFENLYNAYLKARRGKRDRREVLKFELNLEENLIQLQNELIWGMYKTGEYRVFKVFEPKERDVAALPFQDRVAQHAILLVIEPIWERRFIYDSYACRINKGTHEGADRAQAMMRKVLRNHGQLYAFKADISKFFYSIDHEIIESSGGGVGLPIGNLTSQLFANVYMHELDEYVKHRLKEKYYIRYMDDFCIFHHDKDHLRHLRIDIERFLFEKLKLKTNAKTQIFPVSIKNGRALDFLGYQMWPTHRRVRKSSVSRIHRKIRFMQKQYSKGRIPAKRIQASMQSWLAHASHAQSFGLRKSILEKAVFCRKVDSNTTSYVVLPKAEDSNRC
ncbi:reverse transcriptase/maturase family protein [Acinetobacter indicus]|uniref:reverse transcriptase/maturase family protein n=1 Tax=Acinetobacter indicus TaxID=756892 RepID=UPI000CECCDDE|nr:reverse transcriptase/maturase family protein [Acinetobacter indicus]